MAPKYDPHVIPAQPTHHGLAGLVSTALVLSLAISMAAAVMLIAAGMWLERF